MSAIPGVAVVVLSRGLLARGSSSPSSSLGPPRDPLGFLEPRGA